MGELEDHVVNAILAKFDQLPRKSKPRVSAEGVREWVPLSGIAVVDGTDVTCVALGTGMKCLPASKPDLIASRHVLHDWHAEIITLRAFNHYLLHEIKLLTSSPTFDSLILRRRATHETTRESHQPFTIRELIKVMMFCSEAPCGDASMELVMEAQEDATPWPVTPHGGDGLLGRGCFSELGVVRRKPSRGDSSPTLSKSCSDKLALKQCTSLLDSSTSLLVSPENAYLHTLILPEAQYRSTACERSFAVTGRMLPLNDMNWPGGYAFQPFQVETTDLEFTYSRRNAIVDRAGDMKGSNISAVWHPYVQETLINGVLQGRKQSDPRGASALSRLRTLKMLQSLNDMQSQHEWEGTVDFSDYSKYKRCNALQYRRYVKSEVKKRALRGWEGGTSYNLVQEDTIGP